MLKELMKRSVFMKKLSINVVVDKWSSQRVAVLNPGTPGYPQIVSPTASLVNTWVSDSALTNFASSTQTTAQHLR